MQNEYCTIEETCELLSKSESDVKALVAEGKLREFRDGDKTFYRREDVQALGAKEGSSIVELSPTDDAAFPDEGESFASALSSLKDESSSMGILDQSPSQTDEQQDASPSSSAFKLADAEEDSSPPIELTADNFPEHLPAAEKTKGEDGEDEDEEAELGDPTELTSEIDLLPSGEDSSAGLSPLGGISPDIGLSPAGGPEAEKETEDAAAVDLEVPDLGLSGSSIISLEPTLDEETPAPAKSAAPPSDVKKGISVFDEDELQIDADPMGETRISEGIEELEAVGSGSGLLDITQESDDTSLGAALLDVISPTEAAGEAAEDEPEIISAEAEETVEDSGVVMAAEEPADVGFGEAVEEMPTAVAAPPRAAAFAVMPGALQLNICLITAVVALAVVGLATAGQIQGVWPAFLDFVARDILHYSVFGALGAIVLGTGIWSILAGRK